MDMLWKGFVLARADDLEARIEAALVRVNEQLGTTFAHDGADTTGGITYTVWTDDPEGSTETSWIRLIDDEASLVLEINATTAEILEATTKAIDAATTVVRPIERGVRPLDA